MDKKFEDFQVGDIYVVNKVFKKSDYSSFSKLSGDKNPLHHDEDYAKLTSFKQIIVPLHLVIAPLSSVAGMVFPGHRSLYLSHEVKSHLPVLFNKEVTYSSKIVEKNSAEKTLLIRTIVYQGTDILLSAHQTVQVRDGEIDSSKLKNMKFQGSLISNKEPSILITGAAGEIGQTIAMQLAKKGENLVLIVRALNKKTKQLIKDVKNYSPNVQVIQMDLADKTSYKEFHNFVNQYKGFIETVIFTASPKLNEDIDKQIAVNYSGLKNIIETCLPFWLKRQYGKVIYLSSSSIHFHPQGIDDYTTAKAAATNYLDGIRKRFLQWGVKVHCLASGKVDTSFSENLNFPGVIQMIPEQVAEKVIDLSHDKSLSNFYFWLENSGLRIGDFDFIDNKIEKSLETENKTSKIVHKVSSNRKKALKDLIIAFFNLDKNTNWDNVGIGLVSGWDSLRHIEFILELERRFSIKLTSEEIELTTNFHDLYNLLDKK